MGRRSAMAFGLASIATEERSFQVDPRPASGVRADGTLAVAGTNRGCAGARRDSHDGPSPGRISHNRGRACSALTDPHQGRDGNWEPGPLRFCPFRHNSRISRAGERPGPRENGFPHHDMTTSDDKPVAVPVEKGEPPRPLAVYTDPELKAWPGDPCSLLVPFLADPESIARRTKSPFRRYWEEAGKRFRLAPLDEADIAVLPYDWTDVRLGDSWVPRFNRDAGQRAERFFDRTRGAGLSTVVFFSSERSSEPLPRPDLHVFRRSLYRSRRGPLDHVAPAFPWSDIVETSFGGELPVHPKRDKPTVGFCGFARDKKPFERAKEISYHLLCLMRHGHPDISPYAGLALRHRAVRLLKASRDVATNFLVRSESVFFDSSDLDVRRRLSEEFAANMRDSDYILCCRGSANFSFRLYETLAAGRIPVFINTDCVLPFEDEIDWKSMCVWVEEDDIEAIGERVAEFHSRLSADEFEALQRRCRETYQNWLTPQGFFRHFARLVT